MQTEFCTEKIDTLPCLLLLNATAIRIMCSLSDESGLPQNRKVTHLSLASYHLTVVLPIGLQLPLLAGMGSEF